MYGTMDYWLGGQTYQSGRLTNEVLKMFKICPQNNNHVIVSLHFNYHPPPPFAKQTHTNSPVILCFKLIYCPLATHTAVILCFKLIYCPFAKHTHTHTHTAL